MFPHIRFKTHWGICNFTNSVSWFSIPAYIIFAPLRMICTGGLMVAVVAASLHSALLRLKKKYTFCPDDLSFGTVICQQKHCNTFVTTTGDDIVMKREV